MTRRWRDAPAAPPPLDGGTVHVWAARLDRAAGELAGLAALLDDAERQRAGRLAQPEERRRFIAAHGLLRLLLARYLGGAPGAIVLASGRQGKPALAAGPLDLRFNLAHAAGRALLAFALGREVGVDLESRRRALHPETVARRRFPAQEHVPLLALPEQERREAFLRSWVCKEAFAKATGLGIGGAGLREILLEQAPAGRSRLLGVSDAARLRLQGWTLLELPPLDDCLAGLVVQGGSARVLSWRWPDAADEPASPPTR